MSDAAESPRRPHPQPMSGPYLELDLARELETLHREPEWASGHNAKTLVKYDRLRIVLIAMHARSKMPQHRADGQVSIHALSGHIQVRAEGRTFDLRSGGLLALDGGVAHDVEALQESALLLTIAHPAGHEPAAGR